MRQLQPGNEKGTAPDMMPDTYHAPPSRLSSEALAPVVKSLHRNPLVQMMLEGHAEVAVLLNTHLQIVACNRALLDLLGVADDSDIIGRRVGEVLGCIHAAELPAGCGTSEACQTCGAVNTMLACQNTATAARGECRISTGAPDHPDAWDLEIVATPLELGDLHLIMIAARDIAAVKRREVFERCFFHDALNVAGGIQGLAEMLQTGEEFDAHVHPRRLHAMAYHLIEQIRTQRDLAAAERGELTPRWSTMNVRSLFDDLRATYEAHPVAKNRVIVFEASDLSTSFQSDPILLSRVLGNLIKNALEATEPQGQVTIAFDPVGKEEVGFTVHNSSVMPREVQLQVFNRSFSTKGEKGRGLGTFSVKLLTSHYLGGLVAFTSTEGSGTIFSVTIPRHQTPDWKPPVASAEPLGRDANLTGYTVLVAEDDEDNQALIAHYLKRAGADVVVAENGKLAVRAVVTARDQGAPFDVILMDMQMPVMDGYEAAGMLRSQGYAQSIIALTAHAMATERQKCIDAGCDDHVTKPIERSILLDTILKYVPARSLR